MPLTRQQKKNAMKHILENVFDFDEGSNLHRVFAKAAVTQPADILCMPGDAARTLKYKDDDGNIQQIQAGHVGLIIMFQQFVSHYQSNNGNITGEGWTQLTADEFDEYRISFRSTSISQTVAPSTVNPPKSDPLRDFLRGIKCDVSLFKDLKDDAAWDNWNRSTKAQANAQGLEDILNPAFRPDTSDDKALFNEKQKFMYAVFEKTLLTDKGKSLIRTYAPFSDAQSIYRELQTYSLQSTKASLDASTILKYITSTQLGDGQ